MKSSKTTKSVGKWLPKSQTNWTKKEFEAVKTKKGVVKKSSKKK